MSLSIDSVYKSQPIVLILNRKMDARVNTVVKTLIFLRKEGLKVTELIRCDIFLNIIIIFSL